MEETLKEIGIVTGRHYKLMNYYGPEDAEQVMVIMGSAARTCEETVDFLNKNRGYKVGVLEVKLFRPWPAK